MLHGAFDFVANSRYAERQAGRHPLYSTRSGQPVQDLRQPERPAVCASLQPALDMCGSSQAHAMHYLTRLEQLTAV
ncbi:putative yeiW [Collimonas arenae]|nr:putative yeiW [Collimonas arenae]